ncbi:hypothetical protein [Parasphingopyxis sp.]|uniref:hypothetical protein n=1 Tax=Parasphingopyxis sp. TaxID=1920299 RepID=UPI00260DC211|nr:hypothetical protein [Parasphingopyxis sp.]
MKKFLGLVCALAVLPGCAWTQLTSDSYLDANGRQAGQVFVWNSEYSAAVGNRIGTCAQGALTMSARSFAGALEASQELAAQGQQSARAAAEFAENVSALNVSNTQTSFANISYFYACQIVLNSLASNSQQLQPNQIVELFRLAGLAAIDATHAAANPTSIHSPRVSRAIQVLMERAAESGDPIDTEEEIEEVLESVDSDEEVDALLADEAETP